MGRFFEHTPKEGSPFSLKGLSQGLRRLEKAFEEMRLNFGHVDFIDGFKPHLILDPIMIDASVTLLPWQCRAVGNDLVVKIGRVYEYGSMPSGSTGPEDICFTELTSEQSYNAGDHVTLTPSSDDYLCIAVARQYGEPKKSYKVVFESALESGYSVVKRLARWYDSSGVKQIHQVHIGDVSFAKNRVSSFSLCMLNTDVLMYVPAKSIIVNGKDMVGSNGLTAASITDWYVVTSYSSSGLNLYIEMDDTDGQFGKPITATFGTAEPTHTGEIIECNILKNGSGGFVNVQLGALVIDNVRPDGNDADSLYKSVEKATGGVFTDEDHTLQVRNFRSGTAPSGTLFDTLDSYSHSLAVREVDPDGKVDMRWVSDSVLADAVFDQVTNTWDIDQQLSDHFNDWYDAQDDADKKFWERGADETINYGSAIGDSNKVGTIGIDDHGLFGDWSVGNLDAGNNQISAGKVVISSGNTNLGDLEVAGEISVAGKRLQFNQDGTVTWTY